MKRKIKIKVWNGEYMEVLRVTTHTLPFILRKKAKQPMYKKVRLANASDGRWWLHYDWNRNTGDFDSKDNAIEWFKTGGR